MITRIIIIICSSSYDTSIASAKASSPESEF